MNRFFGMMPSSEIKRMETFSIDNDKVIIQAGENGWTILYADHSSKYSDQVDTTDANFDKALEVLKLDFPNAKLTNNKPEEEMKVDVFNARDIIAEECGESIEECEEE